MFAFLKKKTKNTHTPKNVGAPKLHKTGLASLRRQVLCLQVCSGLSFCFIYSEHVFEKAIETWPGFRLLLIEQEKQSKY